MKRILEAAGDDMRTTKITKLTKLGRLRGPRVALWFKLTAPVVLASVASVFAVHPSAQQDADKALQRSLEIRQAQMPQ